MPVVPGFMLMTLISGCLWPIILTQGPSGTHIAQPRWIPARRILGGGRTHGLESLLSF